jgi:hypothetical protein
MIEIKINSIEDLREFVAIVRGQTLSLEELKRLTTDLDAGSTELINAENRDTQTKERR